MTQGILQHLQSNGSFDTQYGKLYSWEAGVGPADGSGTPIVAGLVNTKTEAPPYKLGDTVWWQETGHTARGDKKLKISSKPPQQMQARSTSGNDDRQKSIVTQFALREALAFLQFTCQRPDELTLRDVAAHARHYLAMVEDLDGYIDKSKDATKGDDLPF